MIGCGCYSVTKSCLTLRPHEPQYVRPPCLHHLPEFAQTHVIGSVMPFNHLILCYPLQLLPEIFPSIRVFSNELALHHIWWPEYWSFSFSISPSNEYSGLISFRIDWFDLSISTKIYAPVISLNRLEASRWRTSCHSCFHGFT